MCHRKVSEGTPLRLVVSTSIMISYNTYDTNEKSWKKVSVSNCFQHRCCVSSLHWHRLSLNKVGIGAFVTGSLSGCFVLIPQGFIPMSCSFYSARVSLYNCQCLDMTHVKVWAWDYCSCSLVPRPCSYWARDYCSCSLGTNYGFTLCADPLVI